MNWDEMNAAINAARDLRKRQTPAAQTATDRGRKSYKRGAKGEGKASKWLKERFDNVEPVGKLITLRLVDKKRILYKVGFTRKLPGDFTAVQRNTQRAVLVEVKTTKADVDRIAFSKLRKGQPESLTNFKGLSLFIWVRGSEVLALEWPIPNFHKGKSLSLEEARKKALN